MLGLRQRVLFELSRRLVKPAGDHVQDMDKYVAWRGEALARSWRHFSDADIAGKDVIDFGSGKGNLTFYLAERKPRSIVGVELHGPSAAECQRQAEERDFGDTKVSFVQGSPDGIPLPDACADTLLAFDVIEHVMEPDVIVREWRRVLRPGGKVLLEWCPYRSPWAPHMEAMIPIPWAHFVFGEKALFRTAERLYDEEEKVLRPWNYDDDGNLMPNKWRAWSSFAEQGYINQLNVAPFKALVGRYDFDVGRFEHVTFSSLPARDVLAPVLMRIPVVNELMASYVVGELVRR
ncbi:MAG: class I SAM-dependent methyltransferase [Deltaproteobacteria bacterium]